ncbi:PHP domain-containing protein [uncultured Lacticaseibacillus sp.]|uniref:PHP domain-containing protein n=1 Tax=uncultured Lacticaseibacillus sp. TaxID=2775882 RepID=UPI002596260B|nr:PHP domain-containing protein [uncultured Lacticaseibacillus sp.]
MTYYDQHVHTHFSFDSEAQFADYLRQTGNPFVTTEHLEMSNPDDHGGDNTPAYAEYVAEEDTLQRRFPNQLLRGIEIGYYAPRLDAIRRYLAAGDYDLTLLSFHHDGHYDYQDEHFLTVDLEQHVRGYYAAMLAGIRQFGDFDVLAHFDYGLRVLDVAPTQLADWAGDTLRDILRVIIEQNVAFELNTKSMYRWHDAPLYDMVLDWYLELGGKLLTLGSDAHASDKFESDFAAARALLTRHNVHELATFRRHVPTIVAI